MARRAKMPTADCSCSTVLAPSFAR
jgi:hypothetical protein